MQGEAGGGLQSLPARQPALHDLRQRLLGAAERQGRLVALLAAGGDAGKLPQSQDGMSEQHKLLLASFARMMGAEAGAGAAMVSAEEAAQDRDAAVESVKSTAKAAFLKLRQEVQQGREELQQARADLDESCGLADRQRANHLEQVQVLRAELEQVHTVHAAAIATAAEGRDDAQQEQANLAARAEAQAELHQQVQVDCNRLAEQLAGAQAQLLEAEASRSKDQAACDAAMEKQQVELEQTHSSFAELRSQQQQAQLDASQSTQRQRERIQELLVENERLAAQARDGDNRVTVGLVNAAARNSELQEQCANLSAEHEQALRDIENRKAELASSQKKIKSLQREVRRMESEGSTTVVAPHDVDLQVTPATLTPPVTPTSAVLLPLPAAIDSTSDKSSSEELLAKSDRVRQEQAAQLAVLGTELQYLKNVVLSYLDRGSGKFSFEDLMPVLSKVLHFSTEEVERMNAAKAPQSYFSSSYWKS